MPGVMLHEWECTVCEHVFQHPDALARHTCYREREVVPAHVCPPPAEPETDGFPFFAADQPIRQYEGLTVAQREAHPNIFEHAMARAKPLAPAVGVHVPVPKRLAALPKLDTSNFRACRVSAVKVISIDDRCKRRRIEADRNGDVLTLSPGGTTWSFRGGEFAAAESPP